MLSTTFSENLEELRGVSDLEKKKRGKKMTTGPSLSFTEHLESDVSFLREFLRRAGGWSYLKRVMWMWKL